MEKLWELIEFGHHLEVYKLPKPGPRGRMYHLWDNGSPAIGGQWHYTLSNAIERARYLLKHDYISRIEYLEQRVQVMESKMAKAGL